MTVADQFLADVEAFLERSGMLPTTFGKKALGDPNFVFELRRGRNVSAKVIDRVRAFIVEQRKAA